MLKKKEKILFFLYEGLVLESKTPDYLLISIFIFSDLQFISFHFDSNVWPNVPYLKLRLTELIIDFFGLTRLSVLYRLSLLGESWEILPFLIAFIITLGCFFLMVLYYLEIKRFEAFNKRNGFDFEFSENMSFQNINEDFQKLDTNNNNNNSQNQRKADFSFKTNHSLKIFALKLFNILMPIFVLPFMEVYFMKIGSLINNELQIYNIILGVLSFIGVVVLFIQAALYILLFNDFGFDTSRSLNRIVHLYNILLPIAQMIGPLIAFILSGISYIYYVNAMVQIIIFGYMIIKFFNFGYYFNPAINQIYGTRLFFRFFIMIGFFICSFLDDFPAFLTIFLGLSLKLSSNLSHFIKNTYTNKLDFKSFYIKDDTDEFDLKEKVKDFSLINHKFVNFFSHFFYLKESVKSPLFQIIDEIPLIFIGYIREHLNFCDKYKCPILKNPENLNEGVSKSFIKKLALEFDWSHKNKINKNLTKYISEIYLTSANLNNSNDSLTCLLYIIFQLFDSKGAINSILILHSLYLRRLTFHERFILHTLKEIMFKNVKLIEEKNVFLNRNRIKNKSEQRKLKKEETRFQSSLFVELDKNFNILKQNIEEYSTIFKNFIKELTLEKVSISSIENNGKLLLSKFVEIKNNFLRANKNIRFIQTYRDFITTFKEDEWHIRRDLTKLFHLILQVAENTELHEEKDNNGGAYGFSDDTYFFNEKSCFLYVSGVERNLGKILKADQNSAKLFCFSNANSMVGIDINELMPKIFGARHTNLIWKFLDTGETNFIYKENHLFGLNKKGFCFPLNITVKPYLNKKFYSLEFLAHIKPALNKKETLIIVDSLGNIDCYGEGLDEIFMKFYERNRKQNLPLQVLIPDLLPFFEKIADVFIQENNEMLEKNRKNKMKNRITMSARTLRSFRSIQKSPRKRKLQTSISINNEIDVSKIFNQFLKNEFGDFIFQIILKDNYPSFPSSLKIEDLDESSIINYLNSIKNLVYSNESPCDVYRIDITIRRKLFGDVTINVLHVRRVKFLYRNKKNDSIEKVLKRMKKNTLTLLPKILKQTGILKVCKKGKTGLISKQLNKSQEEIPNLRKSSPSQRRRRLSDITEYPNLFIEEINELQKDELKTEMERKIFLKEILKEKKNIEKQKSLQSNSNIEENSKNILIKNDFADQIKKLTITSQTKKTLLIKKEKIFDKKIKTQMDPPSQEFFLNPNIRSNDKIDESKCLLKAFSKSFSSVSNLNKRENQMYYADEGRHLYKIQSKENSFANFSHSYIEQKDIPFDMASKASSLVSNTKDTQNDLRRLMEQKYLPSSYKYVLAFTVIAILLGAASFFAYGGISKDMLSHLSEDLSITNIVENYKINILKLLVLQENKLEFQNNDHANIFNDTYYEIRDLDNKLKTSTISSIWETPIDIEIRNGTFLELSLIMGMQLYFEASEEQIVENSKEYFIPNNGLKLFFTVQNIFNFDSQVNEICDKMRSNLIALVLISISLMGFMFCAILSNLYFSHKFINSTLKLLCSIPIKEYKNLYNDFFENEGKEENIVKKHAKKQSIASKEQIKPMEQNSNQVKKKVRHHVIPLKFSKLNLFFLFSLLIIYLSLFLVNMSQSEILDSSLYNKIARQNLFNNLRIQCYEILAVLGEYKMGFSQNPVDLSQITNNLNHLGVDIDSLLDINNFLTQEKMNQFTDKINQNLCNTTNLPSHLANECSLLGNGALEKGLYSSFMLIYSTLRDVIYNRSDINNAVINELILDSLLIIDLTQKNFFRLSMIDVADVFKNKSIVIIVMNSFMAVGFFGILIIYLTFVVKKYEKRIIVAKEILGVIPFRYTSKSQKIKKYLNLKKKFHKI